jgi:hypothetical protein
VSARLDQDARGMIIDRVSGDGHDTSGRQPWHPGPPSGRCRPNQRHRTVTRDLRRSDLLRHTTRPHRRLSLPHRRPHRRDAPGKPSAPPTITRRILCIGTSAPIPAAPPSSSWPAFNQGRRSPTRHDDVLITQMPRWAAAVHPTRPTEESLQRKTRPTSRTLSERGNPSSSTHSVGQVHGVASPAILCGHPLTGVGRFPIWPAAQQALPRARPSTVADVHNHA